MPVSRASRSRLLTLDRVATTFGAVLLTGAAAVAPLLAGIDGMRSDACTDSCRNGLIGAGTGIIAIGPVASLGTALLLILLLGRRDRPLWWICGLGLLVAVGAFIAGDALIASGVAA